MKNSLLSAIVLSFLLFPFKIYSQSPVNRIGGRALGIAGSSVTFNDVWAQFHNQAGLADIRGINTGIGFQNEFLVKELSTKSLAFAIPSKSGVFGLNYYYFGYPKFNENKIGLAFARNLGKKLAVGIQINYLYTHIDGEYGNRGIPSGEIGILAKPVQNLTIGAHLNNVWRTKRIGYSDEYLPTVFKIGASYLVYEKALLCIEFEKDMDFDPIFKTGLEFELIDKLFIRAGVSTNPNIFSFGPGYTFRSLKIDLSFSKHPVLGYSQGISIVYTLKDRI